MAETGSLGFAPVLHQVTAERVAFVYNTNDADSLEVAQYYRDQRGIPNENLIGLDITVPTPGATGITCETVTLDEVDYLYQIENPLITALEALGADFSSDGISPIWVIVLGYGIPLAYDDGGEVIAIASRLHRLGHPISHKFLNHTYDRRGEFKFFDDNDATELFITAILDGPTKEAVKKLIDRSLDVDNQTFIVGDLLIDPYGRKTTADDLQYQEDILDFIDDETFNLDLAVWPTVDIDDPYQEPTVAYFSHDAFYWGWFNPTYSRQLFLQQNERRVFLYNADDRSACNIHYYANGSPFDVNGSDFWCNIAINIEPGYASCAGSVVDPGSDAFLRPTPFFQALHQGATLGESYLFASKFVSWKTVLIGDPLMVVNFPVDLPSDQDTSFTLLPNDEIILREKKFIEESLGWAMRQSRILSDLLDRIVASEDLIEATTLLAPINNWKTVKDETAQQDLYHGIVHNFVRYVLTTTRLSLADWLTANSHKVTSALNDIVKETGTKIISSDSIFPVGYWDFEFTYTHAALTLEDIHFELEVSPNTNFSPLLISVNTLTDVTGWSYEGQINLFVQFPSSGFPSNFSGRRVKFASLASQYLTSTETYHVRWTALDSGGSPIGTTETREIIISS